ncbi:hypothetical protein G7048_28105 (plasmid) [Diaphorobacter sp. HDW4B]|nr:hypothetical protein G7048_28105 [Diaphorobacter sp. HDW4B]
MCVTAAATSLASAAAIAAPVGPAGERPAAMVQRPASSVLLGAASVGNRTVVVGERGIVMVSDDGGGQWRQVALPTSVTLTAVRFADARHVVAVGHGGTVLVSDDAGDSWTRRLDGKRLAQLALEEAQRKGDPARIRDAERLVGEGPDKPFLDVLVWDAKRFLAVGAFGIAFATEDGGQSWTSWTDRLPNPKALHLYVARGSGETVLLAGEQGLMMRSSDRGQSFQALASPYQGSWFTGEIMGQDIVLAGLRGNIWSSGDGGQKWLQIANQRPASITASLPIHNAVLLANQAGRVLRLQGGDLKELDAPPQAPLTGLVASGDHLMVLGVAGIQRLEGRAK